jgi:hypothetical protein
MTAPANSDQLSAARTVSTRKPYTIATRRENYIIIALASIILLWALAYKLSNFRDLAYTSDLFQFAQLATSWLKGHFLEDNCYGNHLSIHTYFLSPALSIFVLPFGPAGLLLVLALAMASAFIAFAKILRLFAVPIGLACIGSAVTILMPLSVHIYQDTPYGFHIELLMPAVGLWLTYFLLLRQWTGTLLCAIILLSMKEEAPLLVAAIAAVILVEDFFRKKFESSKVSWKSCFGSINRPALVVVCLALLALPIFIYILQNQPVIGYSPGNFKRISFKDNYPVNNVTSLVAYVCIMCKDWLRSDQIQQWLSVGFAITCGTIILRPQFLILGLVTSVVAWLMQDDLMWAPRLAPSLAFFQVTAAIGFASAYSILIKGSAPRPPKQLFIFSGAAVVLTVLIAIWECGIAEHSTEFYRMQSSSEIKAEDRKRADKLYEIYEKLRLPGDPTIASTFLFRYVAYQDLFWEVRLNGRPKPIWVLLDQGEGNTNIAKYWDYKLYAQDGRFALFRKP